MTFWAGIVEGHGYRSAPAWLAERERLAAQRRNVRTLCVLRRGVLLQEWCESLAASGVWQRGRGIACLRGLLLLCRSLRRGEAGRRRAGEVSFADLACR